LDTCGWQDEVKQRFKKCSDFNNLDDGVRTIIRADPVPYRIFADNYGNKIIRVKEYNPATKKVELMTKFWTPTIDDNKTLNVYDIRSTSNDYYNYEAVYNNEIVEPCWRDRFRVFSGGVIHDIVLDNVAQVECDYGYCEEDLKRMYNISYCPEHPTHM
jgi:hypothetical protein